MYGAQTHAYACQLAHAFENDVEMYGAQTSLQSGLDTFRFENDVEMYGAQTRSEWAHFDSSLRMM